MIIKSTIFVGYKEFQVFTVTKKRRDINGEERVGF